MGFSEVNFFLSNDILNNILFFNISSRKKLGQHCQQCIGTQAMLLKVYAKVEQF
jgi:hypothetical protein